MTKDTDGTKRRARQIQKSPRAVANGWEDRQRLPIAQRELRIENEWRAKFKQLGYDENQIQLGIQKFREENRARYQMPGAKDPEGTETKSVQEKKDNTEVVVREFLGEPQRKIDNPEGVPDSEGDAR